MSSGCRTYFAQKLKWLGIVRIKVDGCAQRVRDGIVILAFCVERDAQANGHLRGLRILLHAILEELQRVIQEAFVVRMLQQKRREIEDVFSLGSSSAAR